MQHFSTRGSVTTDALCPSKSCHICRNKLYNKPTTNRSNQWCIAKNGGGYTQTGVAKGLKVPCLFMIAEVSIYNAVKKTRRLHGIRRIPAYSPQYTTGSNGVRGLLSELTDLW